MPEPAALVPGRGPALTTPEQVAAGLRGTREFIADVRREEEGAAPPDAGARLGGLAPAPGIFHPRPLARLG